MQDGNKVSTKPFKFKSSKGFVFFQSRKSSILIFMTCLNVFLSAPYQKSTQKFGSKILT